MTGRDLIIYILKNGLENEEIVIVGDSLYFLKDAADPRKDMK